MRVGTRLYLAVVPAVLGVLVVAALAYWGERGRQAPETLVIIALVASVTSLVVAWRNTRYVAQRIAQLARARAEHDEKRRASSHPASDELDEIEATVAGLTSEVAAERKAGGRRTREAEAKATEYAALLDSALTQLKARLDDAHLPLHILLSSPFGELNENQEEMLTAARQAIEIADTELRRLRKLVDIDRGNTTLVPEPIGITELLRPSLAIAESRGLQMAVRVTSELSDTLTRAVVDPVYTQEALTSLLWHAITSVPTGSEVRVRAHDDQPGNLIVTVAPSGHADMESLELRLARRVIECEGGAVVDADGAIRIRLPSERR